MKNSTRFSTYGSLIMVGQYMRKEKIWEEVEKEVKINQKTVVHRPIDKLLDAFINILAEGKGIVEINTRVRPDEGLQRAFGREACAEQAGVSTMLSRSETENIAQMRAAMKTIYQKHSQAVRHIYKEKALLLDVDITGMPAGRQGEGVTKGFFSGTKNKRGRQLGRVMATDYKEIVVEKLYEGKVQLERSFQELVAMAEKSLGYGQKERKRVILRVDGGAGRDADINWMLEQSYRMLAKVHNWKRAEKLARTVTTWLPDPGDPSREYGWVEEAHVYSQPTKQIALRKKSKQGKWQYRVIVTNLSNKQLFSLARIERIQKPTVQEVSFSITRAYDIRGGGIETSIKESKQGLGITKRNKKNFHAQEMLVLLAQLAYNLIIWLRTKMAEHLPYWLQFGIHRFVRDVFRIRGKLLLDEQGHILELSLDEDHPMAHKFVQTFEHFFDDLHANLCKI